MTTDIKNLCEGYHLLEQELYNSAILDEKTDYEISKTDVGNWVYFDEDNKSFMNAEDYDDIRNSVISEYEYEYELRISCEDRIDELCELNLKSKIFDTPADGKYEEGFYQITLEELGKSGVCEDGDEDDIGDWGYFEFGILVNQRHFQCWYDDALDEKYNYLEAVKCKIILDKLKKLKKLNSKEYLTITQEFNKTDYRRNG